MRLKHIVALSLLVVGLFSGCKSNMNELGREPADQNNLTNRTEDSIENVTDRMDDVNRNNFNTRRVRYEDNKMNDNLTNRQPNNIRRDNVSKNDATGDFTRQGRLADDRNRTDNLVRNSGDLNGFNQSRMRVADKAADRVTELKEVKSATVVVTDNNAYVAARLTDNSHKDISKSIERKISERVKSADNDIKNVYVSVNPDFYNRMTSYAQDIRQGRPISGFFDEFTEMVERIFPNNANR